MIYRNLGIRLITSAFQSCHPQIHRLVDEGSQMYQSDELCTDQKSYQQLRSLVFSILGMTNFIELITIQVGQKPEIVAPASGIHKKQRSLLYSKASFLLNRSLTTS